MSRSRRASRSPASFPRRARRMSRSSRVTGGGLAARRRRCWSRSPALRFSSVLAAASRRSQVGRCRHGRDLRLGRLAPLRLGQGRPRQLHRPRALGRIGVLVGHSRGSICSSRDLTLVQSTSTSVASLDFSALGLSFSVPLTATHTTSLDVSFTAGLSIAGFVSAAGSAHVSKQSVTGGGLSGAQTALLGRDHRRVAVCRCRRFALALITSRSSRAPSGSAPPASRCALPR